MENFLPNTDFNYAKMWMIVLKEFYNSETICLMKEQIENLMLENDFLRMEVTTLREESLLQQRRMEDAEIGRRAAEARCLEAEGQVADLTNVLRTHLNSQQLDNAEALISNISRGGISNTDMDTSQDDYEDMVLVTSTRKAAERKGDSSKNVNKAEMVTSTHWSDLLLDPEVEAMLRKILKRFLK